MINTEKITLESLLNPVDFGTDDAPIMDFETATIECSDIMAELTVIEQNLTTFEAAKIIKKAKSAKKKVKVTKTKMKAKNAKAKKKGGKVLKITREGDEDIDGGTGPLPTTSDTNGLTDTDLDAAPDAEVTVTEIAPDAETVAQDEVVGTEGADFIVEYEDASIVTLEADELVQKKAFIEGVKAFFGKIVAWFKSVVAKIAEFCNFDKKYFDKNKAAIAKGLESDSNVSIRTLNKGAKELSATMYGDVKNVIVAVKKNVTITESNAQDVAADPSIFGVVIRDEGAKEKIESAIFSAAKPDKVALKDSKWTVADIEEILIKAKDQWKTLHGEVSGVTAAAMKAADKNAGASRKAGNGLFRSATLCFTLYNKLRGEARKVMHTAGKAGGGDAAPSDEAK